MSVKEIETILSEFNSKTCNYDKFDKYVSKKNEINSNLNEHYKELFFRKFGLNRFIMHKKVKVKWFKIL